MHIAMMIDLETLGLQQDCVILSAGVVIGDLDSPDIALFEKEFFLRVEGQTGRTVQLSTVEWWMQQIMQEKNKYPSHNEKHDLKSFLGEINHLFTVNGVNTVWSKGADFDIKIIEHACRTTGNHIAWGYRQVRCFRTLDALGHPHFPSEFCVRKENESAHEALGDARYQYRLLQRYWELVKPPARQD